VATTLVAVPERYPEDPLAHLPCSRIWEYGKGQVIYKQDQPSSSIHLVIDGAVKVCHVADDGRHVVVDIYHADEFFGECAILGATGRAEQAVALKNTRVMSWTCSELEEIVMRRPRLAVALLQILIQRSIEFEQRIESLSLDTIERRLARTLIRFRSGWARTPRTAPWR